jgi:hypothetical protein
MSSSAVTLGTNSNPQQYRGAITALDGTSVAATLRDSGGGAIRLIAQLQIDSASGSVAGTVSVSPSSQ